MIYYRTKVGNLLPKVHSPKIHTAYGKVMEGEKKYNQAAIVKFQHFLFFFKFLQNYEKICIKIMFDYIDI